MAEVLNQAHPLMITVIMCGRDLAIYMADSTLDLLQLQIIVVYAAL